MKVSAAELKYDPNWKSVIKAEGQQSANNFLMWHEVFDFMMLCRKAGLSEMEMWSVLSNRFDITKR